MLDGIVGLNVERVWQRQLVEFCCDPGNQVQVYLAPQSQVHIRTGLETSHRAGTEDLHLAHFRLAREDFAHQLQAAWAQTECLYVDVLCLSQTNTCSKAVT